MVYIHFPKICIGQKIVCGAEHNLGEAFRLFAASKRKISNIRYVTGRRLNKSNDLNWPVAFFSMM